jgi:hypothetical protein
MGKTPAIPNLKPFATDLHRLARIRAKQSVNIREISGWFIVFRDFGLQIWNCWKNTIISAILNMA